MKFIASLMAAALLVACAGTSDETTSDEAALASDLACVSPEPIDQTAYAYNPHKPRTPGACSEADFTALSAYYSTHHQEPSFSATEWRNSVPATCGDCVFTDVGADPSAKWGPLLIDGAKIVRSNMAGCVAEESGSEACGRAYSQFSDCLWDACTRSCTTQAEVDACMKGTQVLAHACFPASTAVLHACNGYPATYAQRCGSPMKKACGGSPAPAPSSPTP